MKTDVCCFIGHRNIDETEKAFEELSSIIERLITDEKTDTFLFGSGSGFNRLCYEVVTKHKKIYPHIKRVYVRAEYPYINEKYTALLLTEYEDTYYPQRIIGAGKAAFLERNEEMIRFSDICVIYYRESLTPKNRRSGTKLALDYAARQKIKNNNDLTAPCGHIERRHKTYIESRKRASLQTFRKTLPQRVLGGV